MISCEKIVFNFCYKRGGPADIEIMYTRSQYNVTLLGKFTTFSF